MNFLLKLSSKRFFVNKMHHIVRRFIKTAFKVQFSSENQIRTPIDPFLTPRLVSSVETEAERHDVIIN